MWSGRRCRTKSRCAGVCVGVPHSLQTSRRCSRDGAGDDCAPHPVADFHADRRNWALGSGIAHRITQARRMEGLTLSHQVIPLPRTRCSCTTSSSVTQHDALGDLSRPGLRLQPRRTTPGQDDADRAPAVHRRRGVRRPAAPGTCAGQIGPGAFFALGRDRPGPAAVHRCQPHGPAATARHPAIAGTSAERWAAAQHRPGRGGGRAPVSPNSPCGRPASWVPSWRRPTQAWDR